MPLFDFKCEDCGEVREYLVLGGDKAPASCGKCNSKKIKKLVSSGALPIFKVRGFYTTDYNNRNSNPRT